MVEDFHVHLRFHVLNFLKRKLGLKKPSDFQSSLSEPAGGRAKGRAPSVASPAYLLLHIKVCKQRACASDKGRGHKQADLFVLASAVFTK